MLFRVKLQPLDERPVDLKLSLRSQACPELAADDALTLSESGEIRSDLVCGRLSDQPLEVQLRIDPDSHRLPFLDHYLLVILNSVLRRLGGLRLHAAAAVLAGRTVVLVGPKGSGKSTLALAIGRAGGTVLGDDQIMLRRHPDGYRVSGCDGLTRLTAKTESFFFAQPLPDAAQDYGGTLKKELELGRLCSSAPGTEYRPQRLYFPEVGERTVAAPMSRQAVLLRLLKEILPTHRFSSPADREGLLGFLSDFLGSVECYGLQLSPHLKDLPRALELLSR
jgi:hypothetical protein